MLKHLKSRTRMNDYDDEDEPFEDEDFEEESPDGEGSVSDNTFTGPAFLPTFTGLLRANGSPILKHPIAVRMGFHPERHKFYLPTKENEDIPTQNSVIGWSYDEA